MSEFDILLEEHASSDCKECLIKAYELGLKKGKEKQEKEMLQAELNLIIEYQKTLLYPFKTRFLFIKKRLAELEA